MWNPNRWLRPWGSRSGRERRRGLLVSALCIGAMIWAASDQVGRGRPTPGQTTKPDAERPNLSVSAREACRDRPAEKSAGADARADRVALKPTVSPSAGAGATVPLRAPLIQDALAAVAACQERYQTVRDYICTFSKRERIGGKLSPRHVLAMKVRTEPNSIYLKFEKPTAGREAIYISGRNNGKVLAHDTGLTRLLAGTLKLDPDGAFAMRDCRHPITQAGIGPLLRTLEHRWKLELAPSESVVAFHKGEVVNGRPGTTIVATHPRHDPEFMFYQVRLFIDEELGLPIHFEAYDWPKSPRTPPILMEEYTYSDLKLNVGLSDHDFDVSNANYAFGRF